MPTGSFGTSGSRKIRKSRRTTAESSRKSRSTCREPEIRLDLARRFHFWDFYGSGGAPVRQSGGYQDDPVPPRDRGLLVEPAAAGGGGRAPQARPDPLQGALGQWRRSHPPYQ